MRLPILSLTIIAVCLGLPGCVESNKPENFLLISTDNRFHTLHNPTENTLPSKIEIQDYNNSIHTYIFNNDFTYNCATKNIYVLKADLIRSTNNTYDIVRALDVIHYSGNNKFQRINHVKNIFDDARSIASDWTTGNLYWIEKKNEKYSIKVIDKSFNEPKYIIHSENKITHLNVYPNQDELFFLSDGNLWYTSNKVNSTPNLLFKSRIYFQVSRHIHDFSIDYETNKLYWVDEHEGNLILKYLHIENSARPLDVKIFFETEKLKNIQSIPHDLVAFNEAIYWIAVDDEAKLYFKNDNKPAVQVSNLTLNSRLAFIPSSCPNWL